MTWWLLWRRMIEKNAMLDQLYNTLKELKQQYETSREVRQPCSSLHQRLLANSAKLCAIAPTHVSCCCLAGLCPVRETHDNEAVISIVELRLVYVCCRRLLRQLQAWSRHRPRCSSIRRPLRRPGGCRGMLAQPWCPSACAARAWRTLWRLRAPRARWATPRACSVASYMGHTMDVPGC